MSPLLLLVPYLLYPVGLLAALRRLGWGRQPAVAIPLALGMGPILATLVMQFYLFVCPGPGQRWLLFAVTTAVALPLLVYGRKKLAEFLPGNATALWVVLFAVITLVALYLISDNKIFWAYDPSCFRYVADRIFSQGIIFPRRLILEPTINGLLMVHPFHGPVYPLLLVLNRVFAGSGAAVFDNLPTIWFCWCSILLAGGFAGGKRGFANPWAWVAMLLLAASYRFIFWTSVGQNATVAAFGVIAVFVVCHTAARRSLRQPESCTIDWLLAGLVLGLCMGVHRTNLALPLVYLAYMWAAGIRGLRSPVFKAALWGILVSVAVYGPYGFSNLWSLDQANPVSNALVPYRESWRDAFEAPVLFQAYKQFLSLRDGLLLWGATILVGVACLLKGRTKIWSVAEMRPGLVFGLCTLFLMVFYSDLLLVLQKSGMELVVRADRYRTAVMPTMAAGVGLGGSWLTGQWGAVNNAARSWKRLITPVVGSLLVLAGLYSSATCYQPQLFQARQWQKFPKQIASSFNTDDRAIFFSEYPQLEEVFSYIENNIGKGRLLLDWMPPIRFIKAPMLNHWLQPGVFPLLDAENPEQAWRAAQQLDISMIMVRPERYGSELYSSTGLRNVLSLRVSSLQRCVRHLQLFKIRAACLPESKIRDMSSELNMEAANMPGVWKNVRVFKKNLAEPGDYELDLNFQSKHVVRVVLEINGKVAQTTNLRSFAPYTPGPQRVRFRTEPGQQANIILSTKDIDFSKHITAIALLRADICQ